MQNLDLEKIDIENGKGRLSKEGMNHICRMNIREIEFTDEIVVINIYKISNCDVNSYYCALDLYLPLVCLKFGPFTLVPCNQNVR